MLLVLLMSHTLACLWFMIGSVVGGFFPTIFLGVGGLLSQERTTRISHEQARAVTHATRPATYRCMGLHSQESDAMQYLDSLYYALGMMTGLADGEVPQTTLEALFSIFTMMVGIFTFATIIGSVSTIVDELSENESVFQTKLLYMSRMLKQHKLPHQLEERVLNYLNYQWKNHQGFDDFKVLRTLPAGLRTDVMLQLTRSMVEKVPFFHGSDEGFVRSLVDRLRPQITAASEVVIRQGDIGSEMFFVHRGELDVLVRREGSRGSGPCTPH